MKQCKAATVGRGQDPLEAVISTYLRVNAPAQTRYLDYYRRQPSLEEAIRKAALAELEDGSRFCHQEKVDMAALEAAAAKLERIDFSRLELRSFAQLHDSIRSEILPIRGIGPLTVYDTAHRLGAYLGLQPEHVYIHAGVVHGVAALGLDSDRATLEMNVLPPAFARLTPEQAEDCLCIYASALRRAAKRRW